MTRRYVTLYRPDVDHPETGEVEFSTPVMLPLEIVPGEETEEDWAAAVEALRAVCPLPIVPGYALPGQRVVDGALVDIPPAPPSIEAMRAAKWEDIKRARAATIAGGVFVPGLGIFDANNAAIVAVLAAYATLNAQPEDWTIDWTLHERSDNQKATLSKSQFKQVAVFILGFGPVQHSLSQNLRDQIDAATSQEQLDAIVWPVT